jgi:hypothetical protein
MHYNEPGNVNDMVIHIVGAMAFDFSADCSMVTYKYNVGESRSTKQAENWYDDITFPFSSLDSKCRYIEVHNYTSAICKCRRNLLAVQ